MFDWFPREWFASIISSGVTAVALGTLYKIVVEKAVQNKFDKKLAKLNSELRGNEEILRADLRTKGEEITALRSGALSGMATRFAAIDKRRLDAIDNLWAAAVRLGKLKMAAKMATVINWEVAVPAAARQNSEGARFRELGQTIWSAAGLDDYQETLKAAQPSLLQRPYLTPLTWAHYSAYSTVLNYSVLRLAALRYGTGPGMFADSKPMFDLVKQVLPHRIEYIDGHGANALAHLVDELEEVLLSTVQNAIHKPDADQASVEQAAAIVKAAEMAAATLKPLGEPPAGLAAVT